MVWVYNPFVMKKGLCLLNAYLILPGVEHFYERMKEEFLKIGIQLDKKTNASIFSFIGSDGSLYSQQLDYDFVLYLDKDPYVSYCLEQAGNRLFNSARSIELCDDKMLTHMALSNQGIKMPKTVSGPLNYSNGISYDFIHDLEKIIPFPMVAKDDFGSLGEAVFLLKNEGDLANFENAHKANPRLFQEFVSSSFGFDFRLIVIGGRYFAGMKRLNKNGDFRSNIACGGVGEKTLIPREYINTAEKIAKILRLDYCGVDILEGPNKEPVVCEVNSNAFLEGIEKTTGKNVARAYAKYIKKTNRKVIL